MRLCNSSRKLSTDTGTRLANHPQCTFAQQREVRTQQHPRKREAELKRWRAMDLHALTDKPHRRFNPLTGDWVKFTLANECRFDHLQTAHEGWPRAERQLRPGARTAS